MDCVPTLKGEIKKARASNYDIYSVVNEFVDNSLDAGATKVVVDIREYPDDGNSWINKILISDNAPSGIIDVRSIFSWTFERKRGKKEIGEFGTGLKSASVNVSDKLTILTIKNGREYVQAIADWQEMATENTWTPKILKINKEFLMNYHPFPTGTTIMLENIRHDFIQQQQNDNIIENLFEQLSWSYKYFLRENPSVSLIVKSPTISYELSHRIQSPLMIYFFDHCSFTLESKVHIVKQHRAFLVFLQRDYPYWEQIEFVEKRKNGNHALKANQVAPWTDKVHATLIFRSGTYYDPESKLPMSYGNVDVIRNHRVLVKNTSYRIPRSDPGVAFIKHELFYDNKSLNNMMGVQFNKINNGYMANGSMKYALEYIQKQHERELIRFEKNKLDRVITREKEEDDYFRLDDTEKEIQTTKEKEITTTNNDRETELSVPFVLVQEKDYNNEPQQQPPILCEKQTKEEILEQQRRKNFSMETKLEVIKQQECRDCEFDFRLLDDILPIDYDHINGQPSNNSKENCQALSVVSHALKTRRPKVFEEHRKNPVGYIVELLNCITSSSYFIDAYVNKKIKINPEKILLLRKGFFSHEKEEN
jgi:hypothetical protein